MNFRFSFQLLYYLEKGGTVPNLLLLHSSNIRLSSFTYISVSTRVVPCSNTSYYPIRKKLRECTKINLSNIDMVLSLVSGFGGLPLSLA